MGYFGRNNLHIICFDNGRKYYQYAYHCTTGKFDRQTATVEGNVN